MPANDDSTASAGDGTEAAVHSGTGEPRHVLPGAEVHDTNDGPACPLIAQYGIYCPACNKRLGYSSSDRAAAQLFADRHNREAHPQPPHDPVTP